VDTFKKENLALKREVIKIAGLFENVNDLNDQQLPGYILQLRTIFNNLSDVDKHYKRKEYLLFPFLEKHLITGPPKVMWGKHDEIRGLLKNAFEALESPVSTSEEMKSVVQLVLAPTVEMLDGMIMKEEEILFPMAMDTLTEEEWHKVYQETPDFGYCLFDPEDEWRPSGMRAEKQEYVTADAIRLSSGAFSLAELEALFLHLPIDITFVDKNDKVRFFSHSPNRVFERNRSIIGRDVRMCHPPGSVHVVEQILSDFKSGKENKAVFLGVVEVTQDITQMRKLGGDQRLLSYEHK